MGRVASSDQGLTSGLVVRPLLLLDVDGVLALREQPHQGFARHLVRSTDVDDHEISLDSGDASPEATELAVEVGASTPLATLDSDASFEGLERGDDASPIGLPADAFAFVGPLGWGAVATSTVAAPAGSELVLEPARSAFDSRDHMLGGRRNQSSVDASATPNAGGSVSFEDLIEPFTATGLGHSIERRAGRLRQ